jgi:hypothetical protein
LVVPSVSSMAPSGEMGIESSGTGSAGAFWVVAEVGPADGASSVAMFACGRWMTERVSDSDVLRFKDDAPGKVHV